jgi:hypothetical protein
MRRIPTYSYSALDRHQESRTIARAPSLERKFPPGRVVVALRVSAVTKPETIVWRQFSEGFRRGFTTDFRAGFRTDDRAVAEFA